MKDSHSCCENLVNGVLSVDSDKTLKNKGIKEVSFMKRDVIKATGSIYDPLGLISPFAVRVKIIFKLFKRKYFGTIPYYQTWQ